MAKKTKKKFEVRDDETIEDCLKRIGDEGYVPIKRIEKPVFGEKKTNGIVKRVPVKQQIIFEGKLK